jgi:TldD protein
MTFKNEFPEELGVAREAARKILADAVSGADDGEVFFERCKSEGLLFDNGKLKSANHDISQGFGLRVVAGDAVGYGHSSEISQAALRRAADSACGVKRGYNGKFADRPIGTNAKLYTDVTPLDAPGFVDKVSLVEEIDAYTRALNPLVKQVTVSLAGEMRQITILRADDTVLCDDQPLVRLNVSVVVEKDGRQETGASGGGGRFEFEHIVSPEAWQFHANEALRRALVNLEAIPAPAGEMDVVLGAGWPGILLHEAVGHGLEGDFNRKETSAFSGLIGERVASKGVTVIDDGTLPNRRGSITIDDEGTPSQVTTLIEDGILTGYMQDRQNARLMGVKPTGNGRRQSYAHEPMPRMTNTYMLGGDLAREEIISSLKDGIYAVAFGGGQVDIVSGKFVFSCTEAYQVKQGNIGAPIKGAMLIGNGPEAMKRVSMIGNDMELDPGIGTCGKNGQGVPVGVGQPTMRIDRLTVGGTALSAAQ